MEFALPPGAFRGGHCGVQAVAVVAGIGLPRCFRVFQETCRNIKDKPRWKGSTYYQDRIRVLNKLGIKYQELDTKHTRNLTLQRFVKDVANPNHVYMVTTTRHVQLVRGNQVLDQGGVKKIADFWGKRKKISWPVLKIDIAEAAKAFDIAEAQTFGLPLFDRKENQK